ncbi:E3 ubiquitin-protein ligase MARCHF11-like isoform X1 [Panthera pardus]|uniref:E3 ubiquitin-protein ligase MARCHF11-like isoform X1 n=1 Tax=Panthera pardus TaxID=9691 RepID=A0A9W2VJI0_PANPR|nr:E3 ubiquitin-protein ligase MARCHF11-like isoform X1 [Panthera pardus]
MRWPVPPPPLQPSPGRHRKVSLSHLCSARPRLQRGQAEARPARQRPRTPVPGRQRSVQRPSAVEPEPPSPPGLAGESASSAGNGLRQAAPRCRCRRPVPPPEAPLPRGPLRGGAGRDVPRTARARTQPLRASRRTARPAILGEGSKETATRALRASRGGSCEVLERAVCSSPLLATPALTTSKWPARPWGKAERNPLWTLAPQRALLRNYSFR